MEDDGHKYIDAAIKNGAKTIVHSRDLAKYIEGIKYIKVSDTVVALNKACQQFYDHVSEKMKIFGVTGTNGKSTISSIIRQVYNEVAPCGYIGTISISYNSINRELDLTTPDAITLHDTLKEMYEHGVKPVALEVSSQGLAMGRVDAIDFDYAIFTNLTHDHLDYHKNMENYFGVKKTLFRNLKPNGEAILNADDNTHEQLKKCTKAKCITYGIRADADYRAEEICLTGKGSSFTLVHGENRYKIVTNLAAEYNVYNILAVIAALHEDGLAFDIIAMKLASLAQIPGRIEVIDEGQPFKVIVDYAHTPDGFEKVLSYAKSITSINNKVIAVFGAAGKRDATKRKLMGQMAEKFCELVFLTSQDVRNESPSDIANQIKEGIKTLEPVYIEDRREAIESAIEEAENGDCVVIMGKGDELYLYSEKGREPWLGDNAAARIALKNKYK